MADKWIDPVAAALLTAGQKAGLTGKKMDQVTGLSVLSTMHSRLSKLPIENARKEFQKLDVSAQDSLKLAFGEPEYTTAEPSFLGSVWGGIKAPFSFTADKLYTYGEIVSSPYRAARQANSVSDFISGKSWTSWSNGERAFDVEREAVVDSAYDPNIAKIAKRIAMGDKPGVIAADMRTPEEEAAYDKYVRGDADMFNAIRDYNDAKISPGRDFARMLFSPEVGATDQGVVGKMYNMISGVIDLPATVFGGPETYIAKPFKAAHEARYGVMSMLAAESKNLTRAQQTITNLSKAKAKTLNAIGIKSTPISYGVDAAFELPKVRQAFDSIGPTLSIIASKKSTLAQKSNAMDAVRNLMPNMTDRAIVYLAQNDVRDANSAYTFFKQSSVAEDIMMGRVGSMEAKLPVYTAQTKLRSSFRAGMRALAGENVANPLTGKDDSLLNVLESGGTIAEIAQIKELRKGRDWFARVADRALLRNYVNVEGDGVIDSAADIYALSRTFLGRKQARLISNAFILSKDAAARRNIVVGLYDNLGDFLGAKSTEAGAKAWASQLDNIKNAKYSTDMTVDARTARAIGVKSGTYNPSLINDVSHAISVNQASERMALPKVQDLLKMSEKHMALRSINATLNNKYVQAVTDVWSTLNLLPRLGIRSVLDEMLFHYMTLPVALFPTVAKGYMYGISTRIVRKGLQRTTVQPGDLGQRDIGLVARVFSKWFANVDEATIKGAMGSKEAQADLIHKVVTESRFGKMLKFSKNYENDAKYISALTRYGLTRTLDDFSTGATAGIVNSLPADRLFDDYADYANLNIDAAMDDIGKQFGDEFRNISFTEPEFGVNVLMQLAFRVDGNGEIGRIAVRYMDRPKKAVIEIKKYLQTDEGKNIYARFDRSRLAGRSIDMDAKDFYLNVRGMFVNDAGELNQGLLNKVRRVDDKGNELISTTHLNLDDLGEKDIAKMLPRNTLGYGFRVPKRFDFGNMLSDITDRGYQVADRQVGTLTRTPIYNAYYLGYRRQLARREEAFFKQQMKINGMTETAARKMADRRYAEIADNMAINRAIGFVDNPNVRSLAAFGGRNLARYYRATEDFWRRAMRVAANSGPEALIRLRIASETLDHAGFIHEDENGDKYFTFPTDTIMYAATAPLIRAITGDWPKQPMPLGMTGYIKMMTPSIDPNSSLPTFSGPAASLGIGSALSLLANFGGENGAKAAENLDTVFFGKYAENQNLLTMMFPTVGRRVVNIIDVLNPNETNQQFISAAMKAGAFYSSNPDYKMPTAESTLSEISQAKYDIKATAFNIMFLRNLVGIWSPVSPQLREGQDVPKYLEETGVKTFKSEFRDILKREIENGTQNYYEEALRKFNRFYPGRLAYTISESEKSTVGTIRKSKEAAAWIQQNAELVKQFPEGSVFLMPQINQYDMDSYMFLKREGYQPPKALEKYAEQIATIQAENEYYDIKNTAEKAAAQTGDYTRSKMILAEADMRAQKFLESRPYLKLQMQDGGKAITMKEMALEDARNMLDSGLAPNNSTSGLLRKMIATYDSAKATLDGITSQTDMSLAYKRSLRAEVTLQLQAMAGTNPNAIEFYNSILKRLIER